MSLKIVDIGHLLLKKYLSYEKIAVDMTLGNGYDTLFLARNSKHVFSYDIQNEAIVKSMILLKNENIKNVTLLTESHENIDKLKSNYNTAIFNLGYLPGSDKKVTTKHDVTISALDKVLKHESLEACLITVYTGHAEGYIESENILKYIENIDNKYKVFLVNQLNTINAPYIIFIEKR